MLINYFLNIRYCTSNLIIALLQIASEVTTDAERVLAALEKKLKLTVYPKVLFKGKLLSPDYPDEDAKQSNHPGSPV